MTNNKFSLVDWLLRQVSDGTEKIIILTPENSKRLHDELSALRQYQQPTDEAVQRAIKWHEANLEYYQENDTEIRSHYGGNLPSWVADSVQSGAVALAALRQMEQEPCEWICYSEERWDGKKYRFFRCPQCRKATAVKSPFCPNCGRDLSQKDGE